MTYKEATYEKMMEVYQNRGKDGAIKAAEGILHSSACADDVEFKMELHGEVCECVLEILIRDEIKTNPNAKDWVFCKGTVLKDRKNVKKEFFTEIDFILFTPECVFLFECKSYTGRKELICNGTVRRENGSYFDVYKQSVLHKEVLEKWIEDFVLRGKIPVIQMCMFNFSNGELVDKRSRNARREMPCLDKDTVIPYITIPGDRVWDMGCFPHVRDVFNKNSDAFRQRHLDYVKSLHG